MGWKTGPRIWLPALLAVVAFAACEDRSGPTEVQLDPVVVRGAQANATPAAFRRVAGRVPADSLTRADSVVVSGSPARIYVAGNELSIPGGAVRKPTMFKMRLREDGVVGVSLSAYEQDATGKWTVDVGPQGFQRPVQLVLGYEFAAEPEVAVEQLTVVWDRPDGSLVPVRSWVLQSTRDVRAELKHFSDYALALP